MKVSTQQIPKIARGNENLTIETQVKLQSIPKISIPAGFYENENNGHFVGNGKGIAFYSNDNGGWC